MKRRVLEKMHEFSFANHLVQVVMKNVEKNAVKKVKSVKVRVGEFTMIIPSFLETCYDIIKVNYPELEESRILMEKIPGKVQCNACGSITEINLGNGSKEPGDDVTPESLVRPNIFKCGTCKSADTKIVGGKEVTVKSMLVDE